jgi:hypothetical protein
MKLLTLHKVLIAMAIAFFFFFGIRELIRIEGNQILGIIVLAAGIGICFYFMWVVKGGYEKK